MGEAPSCAELRRASAAVLAADGRGDRLHGLPRARAGRHARLGRGHAGLGERQGQVRLAGTGAEHAVRGRDGQRVGVLTVAPPLRLVAEQCLANVTRTRGGRLGRQQPRVRVLDSFTKLLTRGEEMECIACNAYAVWIVQRLAGSAGMPAAAGVLPLSGRPHP